MSITKLILNRNRDSVGDVSDIEEIPHGFHKVQSPRGSIAHEVLARKKHGGLLSSAKERRCTKRVWVSDVRDK